MQSQKDYVTLKPIGILRSQFLNKFGTPRQGALAPSSRASVELQPEWRGMELFCGLEGFSHVWLVSVFHQNKNTRTTGKIHPPRLNGMAIGILASRSPHRPNPIGLTLARIESITNDELVLSGVDLVDGTPILDIKPYLPEADRPENYEVGWPAQLPKTTVGCDLSQTAQEQIRCLEESGQIRSSDLFEQLIVEVLCLDPRPLAYRARVDEVFAIVIEGLDVHARFSDGRFTVVNVQPFAPGSKAPMKSSPTSSSQHSTPS